MKFEKSPRPNTYEELRQLTEPNGALAEVYAGSLQEQARNSQLFEHIKQKHDAILDIKRNFDELEQMSFKQSDLVAEYLIDAVTSHLPSSPQESDAPFSDYANNTAESWAYVTDQQIRDFLSSKEFFDTSHIQDDVTGHGIYITSETGDEIKIPAEMFVYAKGFSSWLGRNDGEGAKFNSKSQSPSTSLEVIKHYAGAPSGLPPVSHVQIYIQPDGRVFADNDGGDSHRLAAAILRGKEQVLAKSISIRVLDKNVMK
jgi:hypothetical protein